MPAAAAAGRQPAVIRNEPSVKIAAAYGRLYVSGSHAHLLRRLPGALLNDRRSVELSLTLESLRAVRAKLRMSKEQMARCCTPAVLQWARAAGARERALVDLHRRLSEGHRVSLPWTDTRAGMPAPPGTPPEQVNERGEWKYRAPFAHQQVMATVAVELEGCAFLCEQGTGKTRAAVEAIRAKMARGDIDIAFVVCPKGVMNTWARELAWWAPDLTPRLLRGSIGERQLEIAAITLGTRRAVVMVMNYDTLAALQSSIRSMMQRRRVMLVLDEMHVVKNPQAQVTRAAMALAQVATARLGQTGTPIANSAVDIWSQWYVVDLGTTFGANFVQFRREWFTQNAYTWSLDPVDGADTLGTIGQRLRLRGLRFRKEDCLDLPPKVYEAIEVEMTRDQAAAYEQMRAYLVAWLRGERDGPPPEAMVIRGPADSDEDWEDGDSGGSMSVRATGDRSGPTLEDGRRATAANQLVAILRLTQITSGFVPTENGDVHFFRPNPKLAVCEELVRGHVGNGRSVIVWATYRNDIQGLMERFADLHPVRIDGAQQGARGARQRQDAETAFMERRAPLLIANPAAGGVGLNLQAASVAIYYSQRYSLIHRFQSEDRCHRSGSEIHNRVTYVDLVCSGTIDETVRAALASKKDIADAVVDLRRAIGA